MPNISNFYNSLRCVEILVSNKYKFIYLIISKNASSSILTSIFEYEYNIHIDNDIKIWNQTEIIYNNNKLFDIKYFYKFDDAKNIIQEYLKNNYTIFTVIRNDIDRYVSWINECYKSSYFNNYNNVLYYYNEIIDKEDFINSCIEKYDYFVELGDMHAIPQSWYLYIFKQLSDKIDYVDIKDLSNYFEKLTGEKIINNNVTNNKFCLKNNLSLEQLDKINSQLLSYNL